MNQLLGDLTVIFNVIVIVLLIASVIRYLLFKHFDLQFIILVGSIFLLLPVIIFENVLYIEITYQWFDFNYSTHFMRFLFSLGAIAYFVYNLHLMTIEDMPTFPLSITAIITGFAIGSMGISAYVDDTAVNPIYYEPLQGGVLFILSLMLFNIIGAAGFYISLYRVEHLSITNDVSTLDMLGQFCFFISPLVIYLTRIMGYSLPVNAIFLITLIGFVFHLVNYLISPRNFGYPLKSDLVSLSVIDLDHSVVIAGLSTKNDDDFNKLQGMTILAVDNVIANMFESNPRNENKYTLDYGDTILLRNRQYLLVSLFYGKGKKIGKFSLTHFLEDFVNNKGCNQAYFRYLVKNRLHTLTKKKFTITEDHLFLSSVTNGA